MMKGRGAAPAVQRLMRIESIDTDVSVVMEIRWKLLRKIEMIARV